ncbi:unnamed protein product, partial [Pleuronectes platessa]
MTNELSLRLCISLARLWPYPRERATAVPSSEQSAAPNVRGCLSPPLLSAALSLSRSRRLRNVSLKKS